MNPMNRKCAPIGLALLCSATLMAGTAAAAQPGSATPGDLKEIDTVSGSASPSLEDVNGEAVAAVSWSVDRENGPATGAKFVTVIETVATFDSTVPSFALNWNESDPA